MNRSNLFFLKDLIRVISRHHSQEIYTKIQKDEPEGAEEKTEKPEAGVKQQKQQKGKKNKEVVEAEAE